MTAAVLDSRPLEAGVSTFEALLDGLDTSM